MGATAGQTTEGAEKLFDISGGDAHAFVMNANVDFAGCLQGAYRDGSVFVGVFDGVIHEVAQGLLEPVAIPITHYRCVGRFDREAMIGRDRAQLLYYFPDEGDGIAGGAFQ